MQLSHYKIQATNQFAADYLDKRETVMSQFEYDWSSEESVIERASYLSEREYSRNDLCDYISNYMDQFGLSESSKNNIEMLRNDALVVVGGQQAGLLTGPMYTINKVISIIKLAAQQSEITGKPVVPVFWIAGEDHDYHEVNHVFIKSGSKVSKNVFPYKPKTKEMVSDMTLDKAVTLEWVKGVFSELQETNNTRPLLDKVRAFVEVSGTMSEFFGHLINYLFKDSGLLLVDSGDIHFRSLAKNTYADVIENNADIEQVLQERQKQIEDLGYKNALQLSENNANIFYYSPDHKNRMLLERVGGDFINETHNLKISKEALLQSTDCLSSNVVTRTIVQERIFPVLSFIAGPGEIAYWAEIAPVFNRLGEKMPIVAPRMSFTLLEAKVENLISELELNLDEVLSKGCSAEKAAYLESIKRPEAQEKYEELVGAFTKMHNDLQAASGATSPDMENLFNKNRSIILEQLDFIKSRIEKDNERKYANVINKYDEIESSLRPQNGLQERTLNPIYFMNKYGTQWINEILDGDLHIVENHYVVKV